MRPETILFVIGIRVSNSKCIYYFDMAKDKFLARNCGGLQEGWGLLFKPTLKLEAMTKSSGQKQISSNASRTRFAAVSFFSFYFYFRFIFCCGIYFFFFFYIYERFLHSCAFWFWLGKRRLQRGTWLERTLPVTNLIWLRWWRPNKTNPIWFALWKSEDSASERWRSGGSRPTFQTSAAFQGLTQRIEEKGNAVPKTKSFVCLSPAAPFSTSHAPNDIAMARAQRRLGMLSQVQVQRTHSSYGNSPPDTPSFCLCLFLSFSVCFSSFFLWVFVGFLVLVFGFLGLGLRGSWSWVERCSFWVSCLRLRFLGQVIELASKEEMPKIIIYKSRKY